MPPLLRTAPTRRALTRHAVVGLLALGALGLSACSGGSASGPATGSPGSPSASTPDSDAASLSPTTGINPLTGVQSPIGPTVTIKVANTPEARPQSGLDQAGQVWVEEIEGGHLRFIAVYSGTYPAKVGPVRSGRETDLGIITQFGKPGFAYAGADTPVQDAITAASKAGTIVDLGENATVNGEPVRPAYFSDPERTVPYAFYADTGALGAFATKGGATTPATGGFQFGTAAKGGTECSALDVRWSKIATGGAHWDSGRKTWVMSFDGSDLLDRESDSPLSAPTIVVLRAPDKASEINRSQYQVPVLQSYGAKGGKATVLRDGTCTTGRWVRPKASSPTKLVTSSGKPMTLAPGQVWVFTVGEGPSLAGGVERTVTTS